MANEEPQVVLCDGAQSIGVHNGVVRISFIRLGQDGKPIPSAELLLPATQVAALLRALQQVRT